MCRLRRIILTFLLPCAADLLILHCRPFGPICISTQTKSLLIEIDTRKLTA